MKLYHFTTERGARDIFSSMLIRASAPNPLNGGMVSLTTDKDSSGHGLLDGREVTSSLAVTQLGGRIQEVGGRFYCHDHTAWRIAIDLEPSNPGLMRATTCHPVNQMLALDIAAAYPEYADLPEHLLMQALHDLRAGLRVPKSPTWWYCKGDLALPPGTLFEKRADGGAYVQSEPPTSGSQ